jgi:hypothetical protein
MDDATEDKITELEEALPRTTVAPREPQAESPPTRHKDDNQTAVLRAVRTYQRLPGAHPDGPLGRDVVHLLRQQPAVSKLVEGSAHAELSRLAAAGVLVRSLDKLLNLRRYKLCDSALNYGEVYADAQLPPPPPPGVLKTAQARQRKAEEARRERLEARIYVPGTLKRVPAISLQVRSGPPGKMPGGSRERLIKFAASFRAHVGTALADGGLSGDECRGALAVMTAIEEYVDGLREPPE